MISGPGLRAERLLAGVSAGAVAREMGVSRQYISKVEGYEVVSGDTLVVIRSSIEAALARKEGREPLKQVPLFCPLDDEPMEPNYGMNLIQHLNTKHREREVIVSGQETGPNPRMSGWISSQAGRRGWLILEGPTSFSAIFADYPYSVMTFPVATYKFEAVNVQDTPKEAVK